MKTHIIEGGKVANTIMATVEQARAAYPDHECIDAALGGAIGDTWAGGIFTPPPAPEKTADQQREAAKLARSIAVAAITVTTAAGNTFDGDEVSQNRMARAILGLQSAGAASVNWVLHDNSVIDASAAELSEALALAGAAQAAIWVIE